jgi:hypothetical protein
MHCRFEKRNNWNKTSIKKRPGWNILIEGLIVRE